MKIFCCHPKFVSVKSLKSSGYAEVGQNMLTKFHPYITNEVKSLKQMYILVFIPLMTSIM